MKVCVSGEFHKLPFLVIPYLPAADIMSRTLYDLSQNSEKRLDLTEEMSLTTCNKVLLIIVA